MAKLADLDSVGMTGLRAFAYTILMPFVVAALIYAVFNLAISLGFGYRTKPQEWIGLAIGLVGVPLVRRVKRGAGKFKAILAREPGRVATLKLVSQRADGVGLGRSVGYAWLVDSNGRNLAQLIINDVNAFPLIREVVAAAAPSASLVEETITVSPRL